MKTPCDAIHLKNNICGIYLIRNCINNKVYIGQSVDIKRRYQEHLRSGQPDKYSKKSVRDSNAPIHKAMQKYGVQHFTIEILEEVNRDMLDEREKYWIAKFKSNINSIGYNLTDGGQQSFSFTREQHSQSKLTQKQVDEIIALLHQNNPPSLQEISELFDGISKATISMINHGKIWKKETLSYPIHNYSTGLVGVKNPKSRFTEKQVMELRQLYSKGYTLKDIPQEYRKIASDSAITAILYGKTYKHLPIWDKKNQKWIEPCIDYS